MECRPCDQWLLKIVLPYLAAWPAVGVDVKQKFQFGGNGTLFGYEIDMLVTPDPLYKTGIAKQIFLGMREADGDIDYLRAFIHAALAHRYSQ